MDLFRFLGFCRSAIISLAADFNKGALECECDMEGSLVFSCAKVGGQCTCKDNIIGRQCTKCKPGYYGYPNCQKCDCPGFTQCDEQNGKSMFKYIHTLFGGKMSSC